MRQCSRHAGFDQHAEKALTTYRVVEASVHPLSAGLGLVTRIPARGQICVAINNWTLISRAANLAGSARVRYRHRALPALRWAADTHRGHRRTCRHRPHPDPSEAGRTAATAFAGGASGSV